MFFKTNREYTAAVLRVGPVLRPPTHTAILAVPALTLLGSLGVALGLVVLPDSPSTEWIVAVLRESIPSFGRVEASLSAQAASPIELRVHRDMWTIFAVGLVATVVVNLAIVPFVKVNSTAFVEHTKVIRKILHMHPLLFWAMLLAFLLLPLASVALSADFNPIPRFARGLDFRAHAFWLHLLLLGAAVLAIYSIIHIYHYVFRKRSIDASRPPPTAR